MLGIGAETKFLVFNETTFRQPWSAEARKRLALTEESLELDKGYEDVGEITGVRAQTAKVPGKETVSGAVGVVAGPENGFAELLASAAGGVETIEGAFKRDYLTVAATTETLTGSPLTVGNEKIYIRTPPVAEAFEKWQLMTKVVGVPASLLEYNLDELTGELTLHASAVGKQLLAHYTKDVAGVYSHLIKPATEVPSFGLWSTKGGVDLFEFAGCMMNGASLEATSEGFLGLTGDVIAAKQYVASLDATGHTFPAGLTLSALDKFKFAQARVLLNFAINADFNAITWEIANNLEQYWTLACDAAAKRVFPATQENTVGVSLVFENMTHYTRYIRETFFSLELEYGGCANGVPIGATGENYRFYVYFPKYRIEGAPLPVAPEKIMLEGTGTANLDEGLDYAYLAVIVNGQASLFA